MVPKWRALGWLLDYSVRFTTKKTGSPPGFPVGVLITKPNHMVVALCYLTLILQ
jgi:hypothetical protein